MMTRSTADPRHYTQQIREELEMLIQHLKRDIKLVKEPQARALMETSAEVLGGLKKAYVHYEASSEPAWE